MFYLVNCNQKKYKKICFLSKNSKNMNKQALKREKESVGFFNVIMPITTHILNMQRLTFITFKNFCFKFNWRGHMKIHLLFI